MIISDPKIAKELESLVRKRESYQISQWTFEESRRQLLGEPLEGQLNYVRDVIIAVVIGIAVLVGFSIAYPKEADFVFAYVWDYVTIDTRSHLERYQDFQKSSDDAAEAMFAPANALLER